MNWVTGKYCHQENCNGPSNGKGTYDIACKLHEFAREERVVQEKNGNFDQGQGEAVEDLLNEDCDEHLPQVHRGDDVNVLPQSQFRIWITGILALTRSARLSIRSGTPY